MKRLLQLLVLLLFVCTTSYAQTITAPTVETGPYTPGSSLAAIFSVNTAGGYINQNNSFILELSDATGSFAAPVNIGTYTGFYSTFVNGNIPGTTSPGAGYRVRVRSTNPAVTSAVSAPFTIQAGTAVTAGMTSGSVISAAGATETTFGRCNPNSNAYSFEHTSPGTATVTARFTNEMTTASTTINFPAGSSTLAQLTAPVAFAHYTVLVKAVMPDNTVATKAYFLVNNNNVTAFSTSGTNVVCLPNAVLEYAVVVSGASGIANNFPGNLYRVSWGDNSTSLYTIDEIIANGNKVSHTYTTSSCGQTYTVGTTTVNNAFGININVQSPFTCGAVGTAVSSYAKVVIMPENRINGPLTACVGAQVTFTNNSVAGEDPDNGTAVCQPNQVLYDWYVDGVLVATGRPISYNLTRTFTASGIHTIRLESSSSGACQAIPLTRTICIQAAPVPSFDFGGQQNATVCATDVVSPSNTSVVDANCNNDNEYRWLISPATGFTYINSTNDRSANPDIRFNTPGVYTIRLRIITASCGTETTTVVQTVTVNSTPVATLEQDQQMCGAPQTLTFNNTIGSRTRTILAGTTTQLAATYTWTVTGGTYSFQGGTNANSRYPQIRFDDYATYTVTVTHINNCGTAATDSQVLTFNQSPLVDAGSPQTVCYGASVTLAGTATGSYTSLEWVGGAGTFSPNRNTLNATYTPTAAEMNAASVTLTLRANTSIPAPCNTIDDQVIITIGPRITVNSAASKSICTGTAVNYSPASAVSGTTFAWTATGSANASGFSASGSGAITDVLTNTDANNDATVTYIITPTANGCPGDTFVLTVTVTPLPILTPSGNASICNNQGTGISLSSNLAGTRYKWTSSITNGSGVTGFSNQAGPASVTQINHTLVNSSAAPAEVTYVITPVSASGCDGSPVNVVITVQPNVTPANAGADQSICNQISHTLAGNAPIIGTGKWTLISPQTGVGFVNDALNNTVVNGLQVGEEYTFRWTISGTAGCPTSADDVLIRVDAPSVGGTAGGSAAHCAGSATGQVTLSGNTGAIVRWERSTDNGNTWNPIVSTANPYSYSNLSQTTQFRAVVKSGSCAEATSGAATITVNAATVAANAGQDQTVCNVSSATLAGNNPGANSGVWTLTSGQTGITFADATQFNTTVNGLSGGQTYMFRWTISGTAPCAPTSDDIRVTNLAAIGNSITAGTTTFCAGQTMTINGSAPTGGNNSYSYRWESSPDNITWTTIANQTGQNLNMTVNTSLYFRRVVISGGCSMNSNEVQITVQPAIAGNTISAAQTICSGQVPALITGTTPTGGDGNYNYQWQSSTDGNTWNTINGQVSADYQPQALSATTHFRRLVTTTVCSGLQPSNAVIVTVSPHARAELTYTADRGCTPFVLTAQNIKAVDYPDRNGQYTWYANNTQIGTGIAFPGYTIQNSNESVQIRLVVSSSLGCNQSETSHTFSTIESVTPSFTQDKTNGCGPLVVTFTNTSSSFTAATFRWNFGNGITSTQVAPPPVTFQANPTGKDTTYVVTLQAITSCKTETFTSTVLVKANPLSVFSPDRTIGCSPMTVNFSNTSPGNNTTYYYDFGDGQTLTTTNKNNISHTYFTGVTRDYTVRMIAENECGRNESQYTIRVTPNTILPELVVNSSEKTGCAPYTVNFHNNTKGASSFIYDFGDGSRTVSTTVSPEIMRHTFTLPGTYTITLRALNGCSDTTTTETVTVLPQPTAGFSANVLKGCPGLNVTFSNNSLGAVSYRWDFGDGSTSPLPAPTHSFSGDQPFYTVRLIAINANGCSDTITRVNYINIVQPPDAQFDVSPSVRITIPNYTFNFSDRSTNGADSWQWDFGDGMSSNRQNPSHSYTDTGTYRVVLRVFNQDGCVDSTFKDVHIDGVPGHLNLANAFMPGSAIPELRTFRAKGTGIKKWHMKIFNKWGQTIWESTALDIDGVPTEGWDGTFKGEAVPQGVYVWTIEVEFINGSEWKGMSYNGSPPKRTGVIHLIR